MTKLSKLMAKQAFAGLGYELQEAGDNFTLVHDVDGSDLSEWIEFFYLGERGEVVLLNILIGVVHHVAVRLKGFTIRAGIPEVCTEPDEWRVSHSSRAEWAQWLKALREVAPRRLEELRAARGGELLASTLAARGRAKDVFERIVGPHLEGGDGSLLASLKGDQKRMAREVLARPMIVVNEALREHCETAVAGLVLAGDPRTLEVGSLPAPRPLGPGGRISALKQVPNDLIASVRLIVDKMLRHEARRSKG